MKKFYKSLIVLCVFISICSMVSGCKSSKNKEKQEAYRQYGINCMKNGEYEEALKAFQNALDQSIGGIGETEIDICMYKAKTQYLSGDFEGAKETYSALIDYKEYPEAYYQRGCYYFVMGDSDKGMADFKKAMEKDSNNYELYIGVYETLKKYGNTDEAAQYLGKVLEMKGNGSYDLMMKGRAYLLLEDYDQSATDLKKALEKGEKQANFYLAQVYAQKGDEAASAAYFEEYTKSGVAKSSELCVMAEALMGREDYETAKTYLEAAAAMPDATELQVIRKNTIICYENLGDFAKAKELMDSYVTDYPDDEDAKRDYTFLKTR